MVGQTLNSIPLFHTPAHPGASHQVQSPGGYECWRFDASDPTADTQIVAEFWRGAIIHPEYLRAYHRYLAQPTRNRPPLPDEYLCASFSVYQKGRLAHEFVSQYSQSQCKFSTERVDVQIGPNTLTESDGYRIHLSGTPSQKTLSGQQFLRDQTLNAELQFSPTTRITPYQGPSFSRAVTAAEHRWIIPSSRCEVSGTIQVKDREITFRGVGQHDYRFGTGPIGAGLSNGIFGSAILKSGFMSFSYAVPKDDHLPLELHLVETSKDGARERSANPNVDWSRRTRSGLRYPDRLDFGKTLELCDPRVIGTTGARIRLIYQAISNGESATAMCEAITPNRLTWPLLGRWMQTPIDRRM